MIKCKHSTGLFIKSSYMNQVNSLTSIPPEPIVVVQLKLHWWPIIYIIKLVNEVQ